MRCGGMAEWFKAAVLKTVFRITERGFKSYSLRHVPRRVHGVPWILRGTWRAILFNQRSFP